MKSRVLDSGAFSWHTKHKKSHRGGKLDWGLYRTREFWEFVGQYAEFVKKYKHLFDFYVTVDAVRNPKISWRVTKYLEQEHGLNPVPVVHFGTPVEWVYKYLDAGYKYMGFGGQIERQPYEPWADKVWDIVCGQKSRLPLAKVHGFAQTKVQIMTRYPWYSVDSVTWKKMAYYGQIILPQKEHSGWNYKTRFISVFTDDTSPYTKRNGNGGRHFKNFGRYKQKQIREWLEFIKVEWGDKNTPGVTNSSQERVAANIKFFLWLQSQIPKWPWAWYRPYHQPTLDSL